MPIEGAVFVTEWSYWSRQ